MTVEEATAETTSSTVLVAEDEALVRMDVAEQLRSAGYNVIEASNADEALAVLDAGLDVDLLVTDVQMPGTRDGLALARIVRERWPDAGI